MPNSRRGLAILLASTLAVAALPAVAAGAGAPRMAGCPLFPADNVWNQRVDRSPVRSDSETLKASIGLGASLHPDFGAWKGYGIPWNIVTSKTRRVRVGLPVARGIRPSPLSHPAQGQDRARQ